VEVQWTVLIVNLYDSQGSSSTQNCKEGRNNWHVIEKKMWLCEPCIWLVQCVEVSEETMRITVELPTLQVYKTIILHYL